MTIKKQKTTKGVTKHYHYRFMSSGKLYQGVCQGCTTEREALKYERDIREKVNDLSKQKDVKSLVENFKEEMSGGNNIFLKDAFELSLKKPRKRQPSKTQIISKKSYWRDFYDYMKNFYPDIEKLADVRGNHAEEYIQYIREHGRYNKQVSYQNGSKQMGYTRKGNLSHKSCNTFHQTISEVFDKLYSDAGLIDNPFTGIPKLNNESESREAFTEEELQLIAKKADGFVKPIFIIGIATALREGDICTLKWAEVNLKTNIISRKMFKTRNIVEIPILPPLRDFLTEQYNKTGSEEYILPEHAKMYLENQSGISWRVKKFLESIGIVTTKKVPGRSRAISIKDVHSLRHTFCYYAGVYGIPFLIVKNIVGHVSPKMTDLYQRHADITMKREKLMQMPDLMGLPQTDIKALPIDPERIQLHQLIDQVPLEAVKELLKQLQSKK